VEHVSSTETKELQVKILYLTKVSLKNDEKIKKKPQML
jgi:hypothetical protein